MLQPPRNNIYFFDNYGNFLNVMDEYPDPDKKIVNTSKGEYKTVYKDPVVEVIQPLDREAACYWGSEDWCTARPTGTNYFASYNSKGPLYILIPKNPKHPGERYQFQFEGNQFKDENNEDVNLNEMFKKFAGFFNWVKNNIPKANKYILFASAELINELTRIIGKRVIEYIYDVVDKMERNDDRFTDWQIEGAEKFGYINSEGDIDWDKVNDDPDLGYFRYNAHAWNLIDSAKDFLKIKPNEVLRAAAEEEIGTIDLLIYAYHNLALDITVDTAKFIENNIRIVNRDDFERSVHSKTPHKLLGRAGDYDVLGGRFGWASLT
jgi:hypothetical protein